MTLAWGALFVAASMSVASVAGAFEPVAREPIAATGSIEVAFSPWDDAQAALLRAIDDARREIYVQSFLFTSRALAFSLQQASQRGVRVEVLADAGMNRRSDNGSQIPLLASSGITVAIETEYANAHNKVILIDPQSEHCAVVTGSYNFTWSARNRNAENLLILRGNRQLAAAYLDNWKRHRARAMPFDQFRKERP
ncbi:MAG: phospholipase D family protein [Sterolibacteriaceae bacterium]|nr:phospholipase D family protein [Sterolibacteriaceae bacterium]MBK9085695.1 phospholipase D family protein [Sterolibacteriaceae bacterium]